MRVGNKTKICLSCGEEYVTTGQYQKYCQKCGPIMRDEACRIRSLRRRQLHPEVSRAQSKRWKEDHPDQCRKTLMQWRKNNPERLREINSKSYRKNAEKHKKNATNWCKNNPDKMRIIARKKAAKHRALGFVPINQPFDGCEAHHFNQNEIIYIPQALHRSVYHNVRTKKNLGRINALAFAWYTEDWT